MLKVGITGGYASGKSFVAGELERLGCHVIYADKLGHLALEPGGEAYAPTVEAFGSQILSPDGSIDRKKLGAIVFSSPPLLERLTSFVHPAVFRLEEAILSRFAELHPDGIAVVEAAILVETGRYTVFDQIILTLCSQALQISRATERDHLTREQVLGRLSQQMSNEEKRQFADYVIDTGGPKSETVTQVQNVFEQLQRIQRKHS